MHSVGEVRNNCGEVVDCGRCVEVVCFTGTCHADTHRCTYAGDPNGQPGTRCPAPRVCCADRCCPAHEVCDERGIAGLCCTPEPDTTTCHPPGGPPRCGMAPNNCGQDVDCGACEQVDCQTGTCSAADHHCHYTSDPDHTSCTLPGGGAGICRGGECVVNACTTVADCVAGNANACTDGVCTCGGRPACDFFDEECCGASPGGTCVNVETDPANCGGCNNACPPGVCGVPTCSHQVCGTAPAPDNTNPGNLCPVGEVCCSGACTPISTDPNDCGTCGHRCPRPSLPCQLTVCHDGVCGFENVPNGEPGGPARTGCAAMASAAQTRPRSATTGFAVLAAFPLVPNAVRVAFVATRVRMETMVSASQVRVVRISASVPLTTNAAVGHVIPDAVLVEAYNAVQMTIVAQVSVDSNPTVKNTAPDPRS